MRHPNNGGGKFVSPSVIGLSDLSGIEDVVSGVEESENIPIHDSWGNILYKVLPNFISHILYV